MTLTWDAPDKGEWRGLHDHFPRAVTPEFRTLLKHGMEQGEGEYFARYGLPMRTLRLEFVHGRAFIAPAPLVGPTTNRLPPAPVLWFFVRVLPAYRRRAAAARRAFADRIWLEEADRWYGVDKPAWQERNSTLAAVDPTRLDDDALVEHLRAARANAGAGYLEHFRLHGADLGPISIFLTRAGDWGVDPASAVALLAGSSPASMGTTPLPDWALVTGYDLDERAACELPMRAPANGAPRSSDVVDAVEMLVRAGIPEADRAEWDLLLSDARVTYGVRDDNGLLTVAWPVGFVRRAMLELGDRLVARSGLDHREQAVELTVDELVDALHGAPGAIDAETARARAAERRRLSAEPAPAVLGPEVPLPLAVLPPAMQLMARGLLTLRDLGVTPPGERTPLRGVGIGDHPVTGRACVAAEPTEALARFEPGDIVVTAGTAPAWNTVLALSGGVITEEGGPLSHAAVIARELGLPALVGTAEAVTLIPDGATIELDPVSGTVRVIPG
jgi:pyruvate,water dikinase